jgi:hypothetical protein
MACLGHVWQVIDEAHHHVHEVGGAIKANHYLQPLQPDRELLGVAIDELLQQHLRQGEVWWQLEANARDRYE